MRLFLTSAGITNELLKRAFVEFVGKSDSVVGFISVASKLEEDQKWVELDRTQIRECGASIVEIELDKEDKSEILKKCSAVDVIWFNGGNTFYGLHWLHKSGLSDLLNKELRDALYAGSSAGSMIVGSSLDHNNSFFPSDLKELQRHNLKQWDPLGIVELSILPHFKSKLSYFEKLRNEEFVEVEASRFKFPILALSDGRALVMDSRGARIIGEGAWKLFNSNMKIES